MVNAADPQRLSDAVRIPDGFGVFPRLREGTPFDRLPRRHRHLCRCCGGGRGRYLITLVPPTSGLEEQQADEGQQREEDSRQQDGKYGIDPGLLARPG